ncbi:MAG: HYR domain-containing protein, partial [Vicingaceae bacterium]|nr:HYR domain-containing protein [Vicingaceae bacterium]
TDGAGNFVTCTQVVTVVDNENPTITCPSATTINTDAGQCTSTASIGTATGTDNCGTPTITNDAPASFPIGNTTVTWTSTDGAGNFVTCTQVVTVVDNEAPVITCPSDTVVGNTPGLCGAVVNYTAPVGTDNCTGATTVLVSGLASGSTFPVGITTVVYAVVDGNNNGDTCSFNVTIADSLAPTAVCQDITIYLDNTGNVNILGTDVDGGSSDDCVIDTLTLSQYNFTCSAIGTNNVTLYVTDTYGNIDSCTAIVTVMDTVVPTVMCQNINVYVDNAGNVSITPNDIDGGSSDMCGISAITASQTTFTCAELGLNNITLYVEDNNGNIDSCVAQVTVYDTIAPAITCPTNQEVSTDNTCMYEIEDYTSMATSSLDNCDMNNVIITQIPAAGSFITADNIINDKGQTVVSIIVEDLSGNADTCEFIVNVTCIDALTIPNVFTPNGDGKNDLWNIAGKENYPDMKVKVFNRWGDLMFESGTGYETPWDGKYNNAEAPAATYYYVIMLGNDEEDLSGTINIVR